VVQAHSKEILRRFLGIVFLNSIKKNGKLKTVDPINSPKEYISKLLNLKTLDSIYLD